MKIVSWGITVFILFSLISCAGEKFEEEVDVTNGGYAGRTFVLYDSALGGLNTVFVHNNTISFEGDLFTNQSQAAWLKNDSRNIDGKEYSSAIITDNSTGWVTAYYDVQGISGITLGRITSSGLYVQVIEPASQNSTRTFALIDDVKDNSGGSSSIGIPTGMTGNLTRTGSTWNMHIEWDAVPGASGYQVLRVYNGSATQLSGQSKGIVTGTSYDAEYQWFVAGEPEVQCFVVRALTGNFGGPYTYGKYSRSVALYPDGSGSTANLPNKGFSNTTWNSAQNGTGANSITFTGNEVTLTGPYWGDVAGTYRSYVTGSMGSLINVVLDETTNTELQLVALSNGAEYYALTVQRQTPYYFYSQQ
jgi:hypothetical protein